ncbi:MAG: hypothetical protein ACREMY_18420, partial [bacterium]
MNRSCIRQAVRVFAGAALVALCTAVAPASAATISFSDPNCASFSLNGSGGSYTLTCASLSCSVTSSAGANINPTSTSTTLSAVCSPQASGYTWSADSGNAANCPDPTASTTANWNIPAANAVVSGCLYKVAATSASQGSGAASISLSWSNAAVVKPSSCSISADVNPVPAGGGTVNLTAQCAGGDPVDTWVWNGPITTSSGNTATAALTVSSTFGVTATNGAPGSGSASVTVNVSGSGGGGSTQC